MASEIPIPNVTVERATFSVYIGIMVKTQSGYPAMEKYRVVS